MDSTSENAQLKVGNNIDTRVAEVIAPLKSGTTVEAENSPAVLEDEVLKEFNSLRCTKNTKPKISIKGSVDRLSRVNMSPARKEALEADRSRRAALLAERDAQRKEKLADIRAARQLKQIAIEDEKASVRARYKQGLKTQVQLEHRRFELKCEKLHRNRSSSQMNKLSRARQAKINQKIRKDAVSTYKECMNERKSMGINCPPPIPLTDNLHSPKSHFTSSMLPPKPPRPNDEKLIKANPSRHRPTSKHINRMESVQKQRSLRDARNREKEKQQIAKAKREKRLQLQKERWEKKIKKRFSPNPNKNVNARSGCQTTTSVPIDPKNGHLKLNHVSCNNVNSDMHEPGLLHNIMSKIIPSSTIIDSIAGSNPNPNRSIRGGKKRIITERKKNVQESLEEPCTS